MKMAGGELVRRERPPVREYGSEELTRDDLRELIEGLDDHFSNIERAIRDATMFKVFFLKVKFLLDVLDAVLPGYTFVQEYDPTQRLWFVGYRVVGRQSAKRKHILVADRKLDLAVNLMFSLWEDWAVDEGAKRRKGSL